MDPNATNTTNGDVVKSSRATGRVSSLRRRNRGPIVEPETVAAETKSDAIVEGSDIYAKTETTEIVEEVEAAEEESEEVRKARIALEKAQEKERIRLQREQAETDAKQAKEEAKLAKKEAKKARKEAKKAKKASKKASKKEAKAAKKEAKKERKASKKASKKERKASKKEAKKSKKEAKKASKAAEKLEKEMKGNTIRMQRRMSTAGAANLEAALAATAAIAAQVDESELKVKLVIPVGCSRDGDSEYTLECLFHYVLLAIDSFDEVILYQNTENTDDVAYLRTLNERLDDRFTLISPDEIEGGEDGLYRLLASPEMRQANTLYVVAEDDVVYAGPDSFSNLIEFAKNNRDTFTVFSGNVVNNGPLDQVHQQRGISFIDELINYRDPYDELHEKAVAQQVHASALRSIKGMEGGSPQDYYMNNHLYLEHEEFGLNVFAFFGDTFSDADLNKIRKKGLTRYVTTKFGEDEGKFAVVVGQSFFVHYAFPEQLKKKNNFDVDGVILNDYRTLAGLEGEGAVPITVRLDGGQ